MESCAFIGYQPEDFFFRHNEQHPLCQKIKDALLEQANALYNRGVKRFYVGGTIGADMWAGEAVLSMKESEECSGIELVCIYPYEGHCMDWDDENTARFERILSACVENQAASPKNDTAGYWKRYTAMIDNSRYVVAVCRGERGSRNDTEQALDYAKKNGKEITLIHPETAETSSL